MRKIRVFAAFWFSENDGERVKLDSLARSLSHVDIIDFEGFCLFLARQASNRIDEFSTHKFVSAVVCSSVVEYMPHNHGIVGSQSAEFYAFFFPVYP